MTVWLKIKDGVVINHVEQNEIPPDDELGNWIQRPSNKQWVLTGCLYENGVFKRDPSQPYFNIKKSAFFARFTAEELQAMQQAANNDPEIKALLDNLYSRNVISLQSTRTIFTINVFLANNIIPQERTAELFAPTSPEEAAELDEETVATTPEELP